MKNEQYMRSFALSSISVFQDFGSFLRIRIDLAEDYDKLALHENNSSFNTYEL